jgi:hypothetical protein
MWGASLADLAKKAQELQHQAEAAAARASLVSTSWVSTITITFSIKQGHCVILIIFDLCNSVVAIQSRFHASNGSTADAQ